MTPLVSIIMPCYNAEAYIEESIVSVLAQSYKNWELLIIDDNSIDKSSEHIHTFKQKDTRIKYIKNSVNVGAAKSRNRGLDIANGQYIAF